MSSSNKMRYVELSHPAMQEPINENNVAILKLALLIAEFSQKMSQAHERFSSEVTLIVNKFRQKTEELKKTRSSDSEYSIYGAWEALLQEVDLTSQDNLDIMGLLVKSVCSPLEEVATHKGSQAEKLQTFREQFESMVKKTEEKLSNLHSDYQANYNQYKTTNPDTVMGENSKVFLYNAHNNYILQLRASNRLIDEFHTVLPEILEEFEEIYIDTSNTINAAIQSYALLHLTKNKDQQRRLDSVLKSCRCVNPQYDVSHFVRNIKDDTSQQCLPKYSFSPPANCLIQELPNRLILNQNTEDLLHDHKIAIQREAFKLASNIKRNKDITLSLTSLCQRNMAKHLYEKVYETQEDLSKKRNEIRLASMQLATVKAQVDVLVPKQNGSSPDEKMTSPTVMKGLWKKAFKSLKANADKPSLLKRSSSLLRRRDSKEASPDDNVIDAKDIDPVYSLLKCAADLPRSFKSCSTVPCQGQAKSPQDNVAASTSQSSSPTSSGSFSPKTRKKKLNSRMKSFSLDTPDSPKNLTIDESTKKKSSSFTTSTCTGTVVDPSFSTTIKKRLLYGKRASSVDVDNNSSKGSHSPSPRQSPKYVNKKCEQDMYIVLYNFRGKEKDDLDLRAGWRVAVTNSSDKDWWKGKCNGKVGYFPATYVIPLTGSQRVFQVTQAINLTDTQAGLLRLHKDQIVIQAGAENDGKILIRAANNKQSLIPVEYLNEL